MKKTFILSAIAFCSIIEAQYCTPTFQYGVDSNMITNVTFGSINNTSLFQSGSTPVYENFTAKSTDVQAGTTYPISIKGPSSTFPSDVVIFIDFNQNGNFNDAGESFYIGRLAAANPANAFTVNGNIEIPNNAVARVTRMRVLKNNNTAAYSNPSAPNSISTACDTNLRAGQTEDYTINIQPANLSTREISKESSKTYPNPTTGLLNIKTTDKIEKFEVYSLSCQKLLEGNSSIINISDFVPGTYLIKIQTNNQKIITEKIIKK